MDIIARTRCLLTAWGCPRGQYNDIVLGSSGGRREGVARKVRLCKKGSKPKRMYRDKIAAMFALADAQHRDSSTRGKTEKRVYFHPACRSWHTTSMSQEEWEDRLTQLRTQKEEAG
jgi:hypothetical protein